MNVSQSFKVGQMVYYSGDRANQAGNGAILEIQPCKWYGAKILVGLLDGRSMILSPNSFGGSLGSRYLLLDDVAGDELIAEIRASMAVAKASDASREEMAKRAKASLIEQLLADNPGLVRGEDAAIASGNLRKMLKAKFPGVKFSVKCRKYSGGSSIDVNYSGGPEVSEVEAIADRFQYGDFDGMDDSYNYRKDPWSDLFGGARYVFVNRNKA